MTAQELIDTIVMHYAGAPASEVVTIGHWHRPQWASPLQHFVPQIAVPLSDLRGMASERANSLAEDLRNRRQ